MLVPASLAALGLLTLVPGSTNQLKVHELRSTDTKTVCELYERIASEAAPGLAWGVSERLKRGLADPSRPGVYAKDIVYYRGSRRVRAWVQAGNPVRNLYVGKVGLDDPVQQWLCASA